MFPVIAPLLPSVIDSFYGINKAGAIFFPIDPRTNPTRIKEFVNLVEAKQLIMLNSVFAKVDKIIDQTQIAATLVISAKDQMKLSLKILYQLEQLYKTKQYEEALKVIGNPEAVSNNLLINPEIVYRLPIKNKKSTRF